MRGEESRIVKKKFFSVFAIQLLFVSSVLGFFSLDVECDTWYECKEYNLMQEECAGLIATGTCVKDGRSIFWKDRHLSGEDNKPSFYSGANYNYFIAGGMMGMNEVGLAIGNFAQVSQTLQNAEIISDGTVKYSTAMYDVLGQYSTVSEAANYIATHAWGNTQFGIVSAEEGVGAVVAVDYVVAMGSHASNITWVNNSYAALANAFYCDGAHDGDNNDITIDAMCADILANGGINGDYKIDWQEVCQRGGKNVSGKEKGTGTFECGGEITNSYCVAGFCAVSGNPSFNGSANVGFLAMGRQPLVGIWLPLGASYLTSNNDIPSEFRNGGGIEDYVDVKVDYASVNGQGDNTYYCDKVREVQHYANYNENISFNAYDAFMSNLLTASGDAEVKSMLESFADGNMSITLNGYVNEATAGNNAPVVSNIPGQTIVEGSTFATINLDDYVSDVEDSDSSISWSYSGNSELTVSIDANRVATITIPTSDWNGAETITFTAEDTGGLSDSDPAMFTVTAVNDAPVVSNIPGQTIVEGSTFATINLDDYVSDVEDSDSSISWSYSGNSELTVSIDANRVATITIPTSDWNGAETITFTAEDTGGLSDSDPAMFTVTAVNDAPVVSNIPGQTIVEGSTFATINLDDYVSDVEDSDSSISWSYSGNSELTVSIDANRVATITIPTSDWNGAETITFTAEDTGGLSDSDPAMFTVTAVNDAPVVSNIPGQTIVEGSTFATINLDDYVSDVEDSDSSISWSYSGNSELTVSIDANRVATITIPTSDWNGAETITFTAEDTGGLSDSDPAMFTVTAVNDAPVVSNIPGQTIVEGSTFATINLDDYVSDVEDSDSSISWSYSGNSELTVSIDANRVATITIPTSDWNGAETITFTAEDTGGLSDSDPAMFTVTAVNDAPVVSNIPGQTIVEGSTFATINLDDYVSDVEDSDSSISWSYSGNSELTVSIDANRVATITIPTSDWNGAETITFTAEDTGGLSDSDPAMFTVTAVNDAPVVSNIPGQTIVEGSTFATINLDDYVSDVEDSDSSISWSYSGNSELTVSIDANRVATITIPTSDWNGAETITFTAEDTGGLSDSDPAMFTVTAVNDAPVVSNIPGQTIVEGSTFATINLDDYVSDVEDSDSSISWSYSGNSELTVSIDANRVATITIPTSDWNGAETITFTAEDTGGLSDSDPAMFTVTAVNDAPVVSNIPGQTIVEGSTFATINLDDYVSDVEDSDSSISWSYSGNSELTVSIDANRVATITIPTSDWNGAETITFTAEDTGGLSDSDPAMFTVTAVNDAPVVSNIPGQTIVEGSTFATINLDDYVSDVEDSDSSISWSYSGNSELTVSIDANRVATITIPTSDWNGAETITFTAEDTGGLSDSDPAMFTVTAVNDAPVVSNIPGQTIVEGSTFATINLDDYVSDVEDSDSSISWSYSGNSELTVSIDANRVATITIPDSDWNGAETITFTAEDTGGLSDSDPATFTVTAANDAPVVSNIPGQTIVEGSTFATINLDDYVSDVEDSDSSISWSYSGNSELTVSIDANRVATITIPTSDWNGAETITFTAEDTGGLSDSDPAMFTVTAVNDAPVVSNIPGQTIVEGSTFATINLDDYVSDVEDSDSSISWSYSGNSELTVSIDANRVATITIPTSDWNGAETITFTAEDTGGLSDSDPAMFTVTAVNDAPVVSNIPGQTIVEGSTFATINLDDYVSDVEDSDSSISWSYSGNSELTVSIDANRVATITIPTSDWNGAETITFTAEDTGGLSDSDPAMFTVTAVNDAPVVSNIPGQTIVEGSTFATINLDDYVSDVEDSDSSISWSYSGNSELTVSIDANRVATITIPTSDWNGAETITFTAEDTGGLSDSDPAMFTVTAVNDAPVVSNIPGQTIVEGSTFATINLDDYVSDVEDSDSSISWSYSGNSELTVSIDANRVATITIPTSDWNGAETITFTAEDTGGLSDSDPAMFTVTAVNDAPVVSNIPGQTIVEGSTFATINLDDYVSDVEDSDSSISWSYSGNSELTVSIDANRVATITIPTSDWNGAETITFTAEDTGGLSDSDPATFTVTLENGAPLVNGENPDDESTSVSISISYLSVSITDGNGNLLNYSIETSPDIGSQDNLSSSETGGIKTCSISGLSYSTTYYWFVNVTDGNSWTNMSYWFITEDDSSSPPPTPPIIFPPSTWEDDEGENTSSAQNNPPEPPLKPSGPTFVEMGIEYTYSSLTFDVHGDQIRYRFDWGDGTFSDWTEFVSSNISVSMSHYWNAVSIYVVKIMAQDENGMNSSWSPALNVTVSGFDSGEDPLTVELVVPNNVSINKTVIFDVLNSFSNEEIIISYHWDFGDGETGNGKNPDHVYKDPGEYNVTLVVTDSNGNTQTCSKTIIVGASSDVKEQKSSENQGVLLSEFGIIIIGSVLSSIIICLIVFFRDNIKLLRSRENKDKEIERIVDGIISKTR